MNEKQTVWFLNHRKERTISEINRQRKLREKIINTLGNKCEICGYEGKFLQIHHPVYNRDRKHQIRLSLSQLNNGELRLLCSFRHRGINRLTFWKRNKLIDKALSMIEL